MFGVFVTNLMNSQPASCFSRGAALMMDRPEPPPGTARDFWPGMKAAPTRKLAPASIWVRLAVETAR